MEFIIANWGWKASFLAIPAVLSRAVLVVMTLLLLALMADQVYKYIYFFL